MKRILAFISSLIILISCSPAYAVSESGTYDRTDSGANYAYNYNIYGESVAAPDAYLPKQVIKGAYTGAGAFNLPSDFFVSGDKIYICDAGNNRIVILDSDYKMLSTVRINHKAGIADATGIFVDKNNLIYIALPEQKLVLIVDDTGNIKKEIPQPKSDLIPKDFFYKPKKVVVSNDDKIYIVAEGVYYGITQVDLNGEFKRFFGGNRVNASLAVTISGLWKKLFTSEMIEKTQRALPTEYASLDLDKDGFIYTTTSTNKDSYGEIKKHDPRGNNILRTTNSSQLAPGAIMGSGNYGDIEMSTDDGKTFDSALNDINVDDDGFINALDTNRGKVFQYDQDSNLIAVFGTLSNQFGAFLQPVAVETFNGYPIVLDRGKGEITVFCATEYGNALRNAIISYENQDFDKSEQYYETVRKYNANLSIAYDGLGKAALGKEEYRKAMEFFLISGNKSGYNEAFIAIRSRYIKKIFPLLFVLFTILLIGIWYFIDRSIKKNNSLTPDKISKGKITPFYVMLHPFDGFEKVKTEKRGSLFYALIMLFALFFVRLISIQYTGFLFNTYRKDTVNLPYEFLQVALIFIIFVICNWSVSTLQDGEGFAKEIFITCAYALTPYIITLIITTVLSNILALREAAVLSIISMIGIYFSSTLIIIGLMKIHQYTLKKTIGSLCLTILGIGFVLFIGLLSYSLVAQLTDFLINIKDEIVFRM